ncbi:MAG TPA: hypothetical protein VND99_05510 [Candidatus Acidoferrales bacterium]|nr:hypothetical protein [Candidatus Acidoferrales bacterium]
MNGRGKEVTGAQPGEVANIQQAREKRRGPFGLGRVTRLSTRIYSRNTRVPTAEPQAAIETSLHALIPDRYKAFLPNREHINRQDLEFLEGFFTRHGLNEKTNGDHSKRKEFGMQDYFTAAAELKEYSEQVRTRFSPELHLKLTQYVDLTGDRNMRQLLAMADLDKIVGRRIHDMVSIFHHHPKIRAQYLQVHAQKMITAFPDFVRALQDEQEEPRTRFAYFGRAQKHMSRSMKQAVSIYTPDQIDTVGYLMGYDEIGQYTTAAERRANFAALGIGTFFSGLRSIVDDAVATGKDVQQAVRDEFLNRDGVAFMLMRTYRYDFVTSGQKMINGHDVAHARAAVQAADFTKGSCPAILKMPPAPDGTRGRPIAYEYAHVIVENMPKALVN